MMHVTSFLLFELYIHVRLVTYSQLQSRGKQAYCLFIQSWRPLNAFRASDDTDDNVSEPPRKKKKLDAAAVDLWASWDMHHEHNEEWAGQSETSSQPSHVETELDKFLAKLCFLRKSNPPL